MNLSLNDRVALILGRAIIRAEESGLVAEQAQAENKQLRAELADIQEKLEVLVPAAEEAAIEEVPSGD